MSQKAPKTVAIIRQLAKIKTDTGWTYEDLRQQLNAHLDPNEQIDQSTTGSKQLSRWMHPDSRAWVEPRAEIILAMRSLVERYHSR